MGRDRTLDEFLADEGEGERSGDADGKEDPGSDAESTTATDVPDADLGDDTSDGEAAAERIDPEAVEPAVSTHRWDPEGGPCEACGATVETRWLAEVGAETARYVCADCKEW